MSSEQPKRRKKKAGNRSLITPNLLKLTKELAAQGLTQRQIADVIGIDACTISIWKSKDGKLEEKFQKALKQGQAMGVLRRLKRIEAAGKAGSWQADAWKLERLNPDQFARRDNVRLADADGNKIESAPTVIAPTVVFVQPEKQPIPAAIDVPATNGNGHQLPNGLPNGNGKH